MRPRAGSTIWTASGFPSGLASSLAAELGYIRGPERGGLYLFHHRPDPVLLNLILFVSGAAILALELLASRILTPYFGVSLYIWTGILSITLVALALGYWAGGRFAARGGRGAQPGRLVHCYALMPAAAALALVASCLVYPYLFRSEERRVGKACRSRR